MEQLHATSLMALQNRFVIETRMAEDQGICDVIGEECCTLIPMHTGSNGSLTGVLKEMKRLRDEHVKNSNWNTQITSFWDWLGKLGWLKYLKLAGIVVAGIILVVLLVICCVIPLLRLLISRLFISITGQFPVISMQFHPDLEEHIELCDM